MSELDNLRSELMAALEAAAGLDDLEKIRVSALGKKGRITELMKGLGGMDPEARKQAGQALNTLKGWLPKRWTYPFRCVPNAKV